MKHSNIAPIVSSLLRTAASASVYDIHCHILPAIDDGATSIEQSLALLRHAAADGITHIVLTPHIQPGVYDNNRGLIAAAFALLQTAIDENKLELKLAMAAEVRLCPEILPMLEKGDIPLFKSKDGRETMLLELPHSHVPPGTEQMIAWLLRQHIDVLIAHPERNKEFMRHAHKIGRFCDLGCKLQVTAGSLAGKFGEQSQQVATYILEQGWCTVLASDAHNLSRRPPQLSDGEQAAASIIGEDAAAALIRTAPALLVDGMFA